MSPAKRPRDFSSNQGDLFPGLDQPPVIHRPNAPDLTVAAEFLGKVDGAMRRACSSRNLSRARIADRMNLALPGLKKPITKRMVDSWMADSKEFHQLPAIYLPAFCWAVEDHSAMEVLVSALGNEMVDAEELAAKEIGQATVEIAVKRRRMAQLTKRLSR
jgi:hypothetical protein